MTHPACQPMPTMPMPRIRPPKVTDLDARADRVRQIAESLFGKVLSRDGDTMRVEIPADMSGAAASMFGQGGFSACIVGQDARMKTRRLMDMDKRTVIDHAAQDLMAFYTFKVSLAPHHEQPSPQPTVANITRPTKPAA
jgi:hypothetical protein